MAHVEVTFKLEVSDPNDDTGLTEKEFLEVHQAIMRLGGDDFDAVKVED